LERVAAGRWMIWLFDVLKDGTATNFGIHHPKCKETILWRRVQSATQARQEFNSLRYLKLLSKKTRAE